MTPRTQRLVTRWTHIGLGAALGTYVYVTYVVPGSLGWLHAVLVWAVIPAVVLSGVFLWQQGAILRLARRRRGRTNGAAQSAATPVARGRRAS